MKDYIALYVLKACNKASEKILEEVRSADLIDEVNSGEGPREECSLYDLIELPIKTKVAGLKEALKELKERSKAPKEEASWNADFVVVAGEEANSDPSVVVFYQLDEAGEVEGQIKSLARNVLDPACNLPIANMDFEEFEDAYDESGIFRGFS